MLSFFTGLVAGSAHVISGPDHLAALAPIAIDSPKKAGVAGIRWGIGHGLGVVILACIGLIVRDSFDLNIISAWSEFVVGFVLIAMGIWAFYRARAIVIHTHEHQHIKDHSSQDNLLEKSALAENSPAENSLKPHQIEDETESDTHHVHHSHQHIHIHPHGLQEHSVSDHQGHVHTAFWVGMLHGAAGGGHLLGVLPSLTLSTMDAIYYLIAYFFAAVVSMGGFAWILGYLSMQRGPLMLRRMMYTVSLGVLGIGMSWSYHAWPL